MKSDNKNRGIAYGSSFDFNKKHTSAYFYENYEEIMKNSRIKMKNIYLIVGCFHFLLDIEIL